MTNLFDHLNSTNLKAALVGHPFVTEIIYQPRMGSTNDVAKARARANASEGLLVITDEQTAGRGRMGRRWWATPGSALLTSLLFRPAMRRGIPRALSPAPANASDSRLAQQLIMLCALAAVDAIAELTGLAAVLKWPNDVIVHGRKLAGLLSESVFVGSRIDSVVVGAGINVNTDLVQAPTFIAKATSLRIELGHPVDRLPLLVAYLDGVAHRYAQFEMGTSPYEEWASRLVTIGQQVTAHSSGTISSHKSGPTGGLPQELCGVAQGVDADGALLLRTADGTVHRLLAADISLQEPVLAPHSSLRSPTPIQLPGHARED